MSAVQVWHVVLADDQLQCAVRLDPIECQQLFILDGMTTIRQNLGLLGYAYANDGAKSVKLSATVSQNHKLVS